jgi:hypothetical protein
MGTPARRCGRQVQEQILTVTGTGPVMKAPASDARMPTTAATSPGVPSRPTGTRRHQRDVGSHDLILRLAHNGPRRDDVDSDPNRTELLGQRLGEAPSGVLRRGERITTGLT